LTKADEPMQFQPLELSGAFLIDLEKRGDDRGFFARAFCEREFREQQIPTGWVQMNNSLTAHKGTLRGLHYQLGPHAETKLVRCIRGRLWDCVLDVRPESPTFGKWFGAELSADNRRMMLVPKGFAHGFLTLEDDTEALYLVDAFFSPEYERGIRYNDPRFAIEWPLEPAVLSDKDAAHPDFDPAIHLATAPGTAPRTAPGALL
jgi:dTDP-4-dehydrorhamnose 3,5-epimerase